MPRIEVRCSRCNALEREVRLERCPVCQKPFCRKCGKRRHGKLLCSMACAEYFFFGNPDDAGEE